MRNLAFNQRRRLRTAAAQNSLRASLLLDLAPQLFTILIPIEFL